MSVPEDDTTDLFDSLLGLEEKFYREGYDVATTEGNRAGMLEGRGFGIERGDEKFVLMGKLHGKAILWGARLRGEQETLEKPTLHHDKDGSLIADKEDATSEIPRLPANSRLGAHIRTLYALSEPATFSTKNSEDAVSEFEDRLKRAEGKVKVIEKLTGEATSDENMPRGARMQAANATKPKGDGSIEDFSSLYARH